LLSRDHAADAVGSIDDCVTDCELH
jgi:hypothetical protein